MEEEGEGGEGCERDAGGFFREAHTETRLNNK